jgi:hypothetical protein
MGPGDLASFLQRNGRVLDRLPTSFAAPLRVEIEKWPQLFAAEQAYLETLLRTLEAMGGPVFDATFAEIRGLEQKAGVAAGRSGADTSQLALRRAGLLPRWRAAVDAVFRRLEPKVDERLWAGGPTRVIVVLYGREIAIDRERAFSRFRDSSVRVTLTGSASSGAFAADALAGLPRRLREAASFSPLDAWFADAGDVLHDVFAGDGAPAVTGFSYERLRGYREQLTRAMYRRAQEGISGPQELAAYARGLDLQAAPGSMLHSDAAVRGFLRDVFLAGNGTMIVNNTFVEWTALQALRRAAPRLLVARFAVREKLKPFSSLVLFSGSDAAAAPAVPDPAASFVDVEQLSYYVWLNAEKSAAYRGKTLYLFAAEGHDTLLALRPGANPPPATPLQAPLGAVAPTIAAWLGAPAAAPGAPIAALLG